MKFYYFILLISAAVHSYEASTLSDNDFNRSIFYACVGNDVTLTWNNILRPGAIPDSSRWFFNNNTLIAQFGGSRSKVIAMGSFVGRVELVSNDSLLIKNISEEDEGEYSMKIQGTTKFGANYTRNQELTLNVADELMTKDHKLEARLNPSVVWNNVSSRWFVQLECGHFAHTERPPFDVQWTTPSGKRLNSSGYKDGRFSLLLPTFLENGVYRCSVHRQTPYACSSRDVESKVKVDSVNVRLSVLEQTTVDQNNVLRETKKKSDATEKNLEETKKKSDATEKKLEETKKKSDATEKKLEETKTKADATEKKLEETKRKADATEKKLEETKKKADATEKKLEETKATLENTKKTLEETKKTLKETQKNADDSEKKLAETKKKLEETRNRVDGMSKALEETHKTVQATKNKFEDQSSKVVSFFAHNPTDYYPNFKDGDTIVISKVPHNYGNAYRKSSGEFFAPFPGTYFFIASAGTCYVNTHSGMDIMKNRQRVMYGRAGLETHTKSEMFTIQGILHLAKGDRVWLRACHNACYYGWFLSFGGFLVHQ